MTTPIPGLLSGLLLVGVAVILLGRRRFLGDSDVDRLINRALAAALCGLLLHNRWFAASFEQSLAWLLPFAARQTVNLAEQLALGAIVLIVANLTGIAQLWAGADPGRTWTRQRWHYLVTFMVTVVILIAGTPARNAGVHIDQALGWPTMALWVAFGAPIGATSFLMGRVCLRELSSGGDLTWQERAVYIVIFGVGAGLVYDSIRNVVEISAAVLTDTPVLDPEMYRKKWAFTTSTFFASSCSAVPLISIVITRLGWDQPGRYCRRLRPLWADLTAAVPEIVLALPLHRERRIDSALRLHRMTVEIRDSLSHLKRYATGPTELADFGSDPAAGAHRIAEAITAKNGGARPRLDLTPSRTEIQPGARDLTTELLQLLALADAWPRTRGLITTHDHGHPIQSMAR
ncbi:MAB_1171c family putative transporter [Nocardia sp. XZ_19_231]|uniref:MAB_1171c family putative transporter n=1 Tax=Nocardia sp. XZ_19_231 TaxID=2769252 RepID=UPI00188FB291|nr:MAB_1171c family putative transporter [Nocardia sp. XZ_19_231]